MLENYTFIFVQFLHNIFHSSLLLEHVYFFNKKVESIYCSTLYSHELDDLSRFRRIDDVLVLADSNEIISVE